MSLEGYRDRYRFKIDHYRITFERFKGELIIHVIAYVNVVSIFISRLIKKIVGIAF